MLTEKKAARVETNGPVEKEEPEGGQASLPCIPSDIKRFAALFLVPRPFLWRLQRGQRDARRKKAKLIGSERVTVTGPLSIDLYRAHLAGESGLGVVPIMSDNTAQFRRRPRHLQRRFESR